jgi:hypothetical protein
VRLVDEGVHPRTAPLGRPGVPVGEEEADPAVLVVEDLVDLHVRVVRGQVVAAFEAQPVELVRGVEDAVLDDVLQPEPGPQRRGVDVEPFTPQALGVEGPVPRLERTLLAVGLEQHLELAGLGVRVLHRGPDERAEHRRDRLAGARRLVVDDVVGVVGEAEQRRVLGAQSRRPDERGPGVVRIARRPRLVEARCRRSRTSRRRRAASAGCAVGSTSVSSQPSRPRSAAAAPAAPTASGERPSSSASSVRWTARSLVSARSLVLNSAASVESSALISFRRVCEASSRPAPARTKSRW